MKLTDEIRGLSDRKKLHRDGRLKSACHEAAHALLSLHLDIPFVGIEVGDKTVERNGTSTEIRGRLIVGDYKYTRRDALSVARVSLAGVAYERIVNPHGNILTALLSGAWFDYTQAAECVEFSGLVDEPNVEKLIDNQLLPKVHGFIIENWNAIMHVGTALAHSGELSYTKVRYLAA
jgi:hypothetical protein